jgi:hypothetical protein
MIPKPIISEKFTLEDIRKIRDYDYEIVKNMTYTEYRDYLYKETEPLMKQLTNLRRANIHSNSIGETVSP